MSAKALTNGEEGEALRSLMMEIIRVEDLLDELGVEESRIRIRLQQIESANEHQNMLLARLKAQAAEILIAHNVSAFVDATNVIVLTRNRTIHVFAGLEYKE